MKLFKKKIIKRLQITKGLTSVKNIKYGQKWYKKEITSQSPNLNREETMEAVVFLCQLDPKSRTQKELDFLENSLSNSILLGKRRDNIHPKWKKELLRNLRHQKMDQFEKVFNYGDPGDKFYYILRGAVLILLPR